MIRSVFLDRDGVVNRRIMGAYVRDWREFEFLPGVLDALAALKLAGLPAAIVTNQRGIARGLMDRDQLQAIHRVMLEQIRGAGGDLRRIEFCPDMAGPDRKPEPGMLNRVLTEEPDFESATSVIVGDSASDIIAGQRAGVRGILVGSTIEEERAKLTVPAWKEAADLQTAVRIILDQR